MEIIPAINEEYFSKVQEKLKQAAEFSEWIHLDVVDGVFAPHKTWGRAEDLAQVVTNLKIEVHLMVEKPEKQIEDWLKAGAKRVIVHLEAFTEPNFVLETVQRYNAEIVLAANPATPADAFGLFLNSFNFFQILAVDPGLAGQKFQDKALEKIKFLRGRAPKVKIEVDGGVNLESAKIVKAAGADILVSASYIFNHPEGPAAAYEELKHI